MESASQAEELHGRSAVSQLLHHLRYLAGVLFSASQNRLNTIVGNDDNPAFVGDDKSPKRTGSPAQEMISPTVPTPDLPSL